ncbi:MAG: WD40 domain-containing protein [Chitinophagales bacterium]|nr:WD40 domain-containing protein [Chitinophagales bacterium]
MSKEKFATLFKEYKGHNGSVYTLAYDEEKDELYSAGGDGWIVKWQGAVREMTDTLCNTKRRSSA